MLRLLLPAAFLALAACATADDASPTSDSGETARLTEGRWTGGLTPMNHPETVTPISYDVGYEGDALVLTLGGPGGGTTPARDAHLDGDTLRFVFDEPDAGVPLACALGRADGGYAGRCADAGGKWAHFTMAPPAE